MMPSKLRLPEVPSKSPSPPVFKEVTDTKSHIMGRIHRSLFGEWKKVVSKIAAETMKGKDFEKVGIYSATTILHFLP